MPAFAAVAIVAMAMFQIARLMFAAVFMFLSLYFTHPKVMLPLTALCGSVVLVFIVAGAGSSSSQTASYDRAKDAAHHWHAVMRKEAKTGKGPRYWRAARKYEAAQQGMAPVEGEKRAEKAQDYWRERMNNVKYHSPRWRSACQQFLAAGRRSGNDAYWVNQQAKECSAK